MLARAMASEPFSAEPCAEIAYAAGSLSWCGKRVRAAAGRSGVRQDKREGDGATPAGTFPLLGVHYRADRLPAPATRLPLQPIRPDDGWVDDPASPDYNQLVKLPHPASHERLWLDDALYDILIVIGYNYDPPVPGRGSAIFLHLARPDYGPTAGCIAVALPDMLDLLKTVGPGTRLTAS